MACFLVVLVFKMEAVILNVTNDELKTGLRYIVMTINLSNTKQTRRNLKAIN